MNNINLRWRRSDTRLGALFAAWNVIVQTGVFSSQKHT